MRTMQSTTSRELGPNPTVARRSRGSGVRPRNASVPPRRWAASDTAWSAGIASTGRAAKRGGWPARSPPRGARDADRTPSRGPIATIPPGRRPAAHRFAAPGTRSRRDGERPPGGRGRRPRPARRARRGLSGRRGRGPGGGLRPSTMHPRGEVREALRAAPAPIRRRPDIVFAGLAAERGRPGEWVVEMGHLLGLHDAPLLGIPPARRMAFLRRCEFSRVEGGRVVEQALRLDLPALMAQAGVSPVPTRTGAAVSTPGPRSRDGLLHGPRPAEEGRATPALVERMIARLVGRGAHDAGGPARGPRTDMLWWAPRESGRPTPRSAISSGIAAPSRRCWSSSPATATRPGWRWASMAGSSAVPV